jgi:hypothetical protein
VFFFYKYLEIYLTVSDNIKCMWFSHSACVRKNAAHKESSQEKSHVHRAKFNGRPKLPGWLGERWHSRESGPGVAFIEEEG